MVFHSVSETETPPLTPPPPPPPPTMGSSAFPAKSHPVHNFPLTNFKWSLNHPNSPSRFGTNKLGDSGLNPVLRFGSSPNRTENNRNSSGLGDSGPDDKPGSDGEGGKGVEKPVEPGVEKLVEPVEVSEKKVKGSEGKLKSKILIRLPGRNKVSDSEDKGSGSEDEAEPEFSFEDEEPNFQFVKTWNLRPRKAITKPMNNPNNGGGGSRNGGPQAQASRPRARPRQVMTPARARAQARAAASKEKAKAAAAAQKGQEFSVPLTKEEIEEDFVRMTGARPPKKPKKRARVVQKQLDGGFPGLWLTNVTPDLYRVPDPPLKG